MFGQVWVKLLRSGYKTALLVDDQPIGCAMNYGDTEIKPRNAVEADLANVTGYSRLTFIKPVNNCCFFRVCFFDVF